jgi:hypothetical protein
MQWININDKAPEDGQHVIYYFEPLGMFMGYYERCKGEAALYGTHCFESASGFLTDDVTHWMPAPEAPGNAQQQVQPDNAEKDIPF